jgi:hypothetical protein
MMKNRWIVILRADRLSLLFEELTLCSLFNYFAQPHELIYALIGPHITPTFNMVHRRGANRAQNYIAPEIAGQGALPELGPCFRQKRAAP